ncbi:protein kinase [Cryobacterium sp. SO2]|uniref:protein kinase domain-containing protein n=1 Tax=Cryobacterium sp. SO2 TaxID=1897060 RepID=UPI00223E677C|nr:protein kinase [Cryobacterium sp. SO2]WEO78377.1 protein kinase [Cryobacterium sp. SO2]
MPAPEIDPISLPWRPALSAPTEPLHDPSRSDALVGLVLADRFRLDRLIGTGGMATVYEAADLALGRTVALKLFRMDTADDSGPQRQSGEVMVLASLNHFALVTLFDAGTENVAGVTRSFIVMEYVDGSDLRSRIGDGAVAPAEVARMGADLAEALHYVHAKGIIHRDIKPANVLLAPSDFPGRVSHAKLADFGIARLFDATRLTSTGAVLGTAGYLSPEQALGQPIGPPSDVYSLGLVLLESLTATRSYPGTAIESAMARLQRQPEIPAELGTEWCAVLAGMTARDPADRLTSADAAVRLRELVPAGSAETVPAPALTPAEEATALMTGFGDEPTRVLPRAEPADPTADTERLDQTARLDPAPATIVAAGSPARRRSLARVGRRPLIIGVLVALVAAIALVFLVQPADPAPEPPGYPAVDGDLGTHLQQLQESVNP